MTLVPLRRWRQIARILVAGALTVPVPVQAFPEVVATRGLPSSLAAEYGMAVPVGPPAPAGTYAIATRWGFEIRSAVADDAEPVGRFRTSGVTRTLAVDGSTVYLFTGSRGIVSVDVSDPTEPGALGSLAGIGTVTLGAVSGAGDALAAWSDHGLLFLDAAGDGSLSLRATVAFADGREVRAIQARSDSFLVASERVTPVRRLFLNLYRYTAGDSDPVLLREVSVPLQAPSDLVWTGDLAFLATGNSGVTVVNVRTGGFRTTPIPGSRSVRDLDVNDSLVVMTLSAAGLGKLRRAGADGDSLVSFTSENLALEPVRVTVLGTRAVVSSQDALSAGEPDEIARSAIERRDLDVLSTFAPTGGTGRTRRVVWDGGYAYVADYVGGLRVYRAGGADSSLVGVLPAPPFGRVVDIALDPARRRAYLATMAGGFLVVDISDPSAPALLATLPLSGQASAVAVVDSGLVVVGKRGGQPSAGVSFVDVTLPTAPFVRGEVGPPFQDPRAIAVKDTVAFVADALIGVQAVGFGNPDQPGTVGDPSQAGARDLHLSGNQLLVGTGSQGLQIVDVFLPSAPVLRSTFFTPPIQGVARSGNSAVLFLGQDEALVVDISDPFAAAPRGPIAVPGMSRDGVWVGDTLLVAAGLSLERYLVSPSATAVPALLIETDGGALQPRARISWTVPAPPGLVGWNLHREASTDPVSGTDPDGVRVNGPLLPAGATGTVDDAVPSGVTLRYRLEGFFEDGSARKLAEGTYRVDAAPAVGRAYPNPYRPGPGLVTVPFTWSSSETGAIDATVHDAHGRVVRRMAVPLPAGGFGTVTWDGRNGSGRAVSSGIYFIRIHGRGVDEASRVVLVR